MRFNHVLAALLVCTKIVLLAQNQAFANSSSSAVTFSVDELRKIAQETTIFISSEGENGSGLIIARKAQSYYVLTSAHVLSANDGYQITTPDRRRYEASTVARRLPGLDLAILEFKSQQSYRVATLANYDQTSKGLIDVGNVYISGWDGSNSSSQPVFSCGTKFQGDIASLLFIRKDPVSDGYELAYTNITQPGLSGGPIFDVQGRVVGVHGQAEGSNFESLGSIKLGFSLGIPIQRFLQFIEKSSIQLPLVIEQKPPKNSSSQSWSGSDPCEKSTPSLPTADSDGLDWANYANSLLRLFRLVDALSAYEKAVERKEELYQVWYGQGLTLLFLDRPNEALKSFNKALDLLARQSEFTNVEELRSANLERSALLRYKGMLLSRKQSYQEALVSYDEALRFQPNNSQIWMLKAGALLNLNQDAEAINAYTKAIQIEHRPLFFLTRSGLYSQNGQYSLAIEDLNSVIKLDPTNFQAYASRGALKKKLGDQEGSRSDYEQVYKLTYQNFDSSQPNFALILITRHDDR